MESAGASAKMYFCYYSGTIYYIGIKLCKYEALMILHKIQFREFIMDTANGSYKYFPEKKMKNLAKKTVFSL